MSDQKNWYDVDEDRQGSASETSGDYYGNGGTSTGNGYDYNGDQKQPDKAVNSGNPRFGTAALVFGIGSLATMWTGFGSIACGAAGIMFANLSKRKNGPFPPKAKPGLVMSIIGMVIGLILVAYAVMVIVIASSQDGFLEHFKDEYSSMYQQVYGEELDWNQLGFDFDEYEQYLEMLKSSGN